MKKSSNGPKETPLTVAQLAAATQVLGSYAGANTEAEHQAEAVRLGSQSYYRMMLANALLAFFARPLKTAQNRIRPCQIYERNMLPPYI